MNTRKDHFGWHTRLTPAGWIGVIVTNADGIMLEHVKTTPQANERIAEAVADRVHRYVAAQSNGIADGKWEPIAA